MDADVIKVPANGHKQPPLVHQGEDGDRVACQNLQSVLRCCLHVAAVEQSSPACHSAWAPICCPSASFHQHFWRAALAGRSLVGCVSGRASRKRMLLGESGQRCKDCCHAEAAWSQLCISYVHLWHHHCSGMLGVHTWRADIKSTP